MELKLAKNEQIVKSWDYALSGSTFSKKKKVQHNLTLTNKRVITSAQNDISLERHEIPVKSIKVVSGNFKKNRGFWPKVKLVFGAILCIILIGIPIVMSALEQLRSCHFELELVTEGIEGTALALGVNAGTTAPAKTGFFARLFSKFKPGFKIAVNKEMAKEVLDEIGAIVLDAKEDE